jgi:hypothetical protein
MPVLSGVSATRRTVDAAITASGGKAASKRHLGETLRERHRKSGALGRVAGAIPATRSDLYEKVSSLAVFDFVEFEPVLHSV